MSDGGLRELERRWRASGAVEDEARWHVARVRAGALEPAKLALAAWAGWPAAVVAADESRTPTAPPSWLRRLLGGGSRAPGPSDLVGGGLPGLALWFEAGLRDASVEARRRAALAEVERVVALLDAALRGRGRETAADDTAHLALVDPVAGWLVGVHAALRDAAYAATDALLAGTPYVPPQRVRQLDGPIPDAFGAAFFAAWGPVKQALRAAGHAGPEADTWWRAYGSAAAERTASATAEAAAWAVATRAAQRAALAPWALGLGDPLRDRRPSLDALEVASPCPERWEAMRPLDDSGRTRACDRCRLRVHDLSALSRDEAEALIAEHTGERLCVRYYRRADGRVQTRDCPSGVEALLSITQQPPVARMGSVAPRRTTS